MKFLPSKKVVSIFILVAATVASAMIAFGRDKASTAINYANNMVAGGKISLPQNENWQNELSQSSMGFAPAAEEAASTPQTLTDTVSTSFMSNYLAMKQNGSLTADSAQKLIDQTTDYIQKSTDASVQKITEADLKIVSDNGRQTIEQYGENLGQAIRGKKPSDIQAEVAAITKIVQSGDFSSAAQIESIIASYQKVRDNLIKMPVPKTFVKAHIDITNSILGVAAAFKQIKNINNDPIRGISALKLYQDSLLTGAGAIQATISFIQKNGIVYKQGSGGYYLIYGL